jgi:group I intron endonuclease
MIVYKITNKVNGLKYVGISSKSGKARWNQHLRFAKQTKPAQLIDRAIRLHGAANFTFETLETLQHEQGLAELEKREVYWINRLKTFDRKIGYNLALGGYVNAGHQRTESHKKLARQRSNSPVHQYTLTGAYVGSFRTIADAAEASGTARANIGAAIAGRRPSAGGFIWVAASPDAKPQRKIEPYKRTAHNATKVYQFKKDGTPVAEFASAREAERQTRIGFKLISSALNGTALTAGGFAWSKNERLSSTHIRKISRKKGGMQKLRPVVVYDETGACVAELASLSAAARETEVPASSVYHCCTGIREFAISETHGACRFRYAEKAPKRLEPFAGDVIRGHPRQVACYDSAGAQIEIYASLVDAANATKISYSNITQAATGARRTAGGLRWQYHSKKRRSPRMLSPQSKKVKVCQFNYHGKLVASFSSYAAAAKTVPVSSGTISRAAQGRLYTCAGHYWRLFAEEEIPEQISTPPPRGEGKVF